MSNINNMSIAEKRALLKELIQKKRQKVTVRRYPVSFAQRRFWLLEKMLDQPGAYNMPVAVCLKGALNIEVLQDVLDTLVARHGVFRTIYVESDDKIEQEVSSVGSFPITLRDFSNQPKPQRKRKAMSALSEDAWSPFDLGSEPPMRALLLRISSLEHWLQITMHHICSDGWSLAILTQEIMQLYAEFSRGNTSNLEQLSLQYSDFAVWQNKQAAGRGFEDSLSFWKRKLVQPSTLELPLDKQRPPVQSYHGSKVAFQLSEDLTSCLHTLARRSQSSLFMVLMAVYQVILARYSGQTDILVGSPGAGRNRRELEGIIGCFVNTLVVRGNLEGKPSFLSFLEQIRLTTLEAFTHQNLPFEEIVEAVETKRDPSRPILVQTVLALQNVPQRTTSSTGLSVTPLEPDGITVRFDLEFHLWQKNNKLEGYLLYNTSLFTRSSMERMAAQIAHLLAAVTADPGRSIYSYALVAPPCALSNGPVSFYDNGSLSDQFRKVVDDHGESIAIEHDGVCLRYHELDTKTDILAGRLQAQGVQPGDLVGVRLERTPALIAAFVAIIKAGAAYLPLDLALPAERIRFMLDDSGADVVISDGEHRIDLPEDDTIRVVDLSAEAENIQNFVSVPISSSYPAYVMYTSGSTGRPKGVAVPQRAVNRLINNSNYISFEKGDRIAQISNTSFDAATFELWGSLLSGATLVMLRREDTLDGGSLASTLQEKRIDSLFMTTALFNQIVRRQPDVFREIRDVLIGGEQHDLDCFRKVLEAGAPKRLLHVYGPTENTTFSTWYTVNDLSSDAHTVPIGIPLSNSSCHVLDRYQQPVPQGVVGELYVGGAGLADGYWRRPDLTAESFIPDPFSVSGGARLYKTGDLVRLDDAGALEFIGRADNQIKLRGMRIELGEIEAALMSHDCVSEAVARLVDGASEDGRLVAYWVSAPGVGSSPSELRSYLAGKLPSFALPAALVRLDRLPLNANGKVDRTRLPLPTDADISHSRGDGTTVEGSPLMEIVSHIWGNILGLDHLSPEDNFFELGGHSLLATRVTSRLRRLLGIDVPIRLLFETSTLADFAARVEVERRGSTGVAELRLEPVARNEDLVLSHAQLRLWFMEQIAPLSPAYYINMALELHGPLDIMAMETALNDLRNRHEILRTGYIQVDGEARQHHRSSSHMELMSADLCDRPGELEELLVDFAQKPFDLETGDVMRIAMFRLSAECHVLALSIHHIAADGWSLGILTRELSIFYQARLHGRAAEVSPLPIQYGDFAVWQRQWLQGEALRIQLDYWRNELDDLPCVELPTDHPRPPQLSFTGATIRTEIGADIAERLVALGRKHECTLYMVLLAAYQALLGYYSGQEDIVTGSPIANRNRDELETLIGFFVNMLVMRNDLSGDPDFPTLLERVRKKALNGYAHQDVPFELVVDEVAPARATNRHPLFQIHFALQSATVEEPEFRDLRVRAIGAEVKWVRFDLECHLWHEEDGAIRGFWVYNTDLFEAATVAGFANHFVDLLDGWSRHPHLPLGDAIRPQAPVHLPAPTPIEISGSLPYRFIQVVQKHGERTALVLGSESLSYNELNRRANRLAHRLIEVGVGPEVRVGLVFTRSTELLVALLAVLKTGGAYVPLDPNYPAERTAYMANDAGVRLVLSDSGDVDIGESVEVLKSSAAAAAGYPDSTPDVLIRPDQLAYVLYTSGSTGKPKGVAVTHGNVLRLIDGCQRRYCFDQDDVWTLFHSYSFDFSVWEIWGAWLNGGKLVVVPYEVSRTPDDFLDLLVDEKVTVLNQTPTAFYGLIKSDQSSSYRSDAMALRFVIFGGEALELVRLRPWFERHGDRKPSLVNMYGITETTVHVSWQWLTEDMAEKGQGSLIGAALPDLAWYLLDSRMYPVAPGAPGELYISGGGLSRGYLNRPDLTAEVFVPDPFAQVPGARMYKTGDLARCRTDGALEYIRRVDHQVQVRGFRIELGEIESTLAAHPEVKEVAVTCSIDVNNLQQLNGYIVDRQKGETTADDELVEQWRKVFNSTYSEDGENRGDAAFNIRGWSSSYTGSGIPEEQMREWLDQTVRRILELAPRRVLEIGCGTGMILFSVAPHCESYCGIDLSSSTINSLQREIKEREMTNVSLHEGPADYIETLEGQLFDLVIINSVVQYFPSEAYLSRILEAAVELTTPGGCLFVGDVRSLPLLAAFNASVAVCLSDSNAKRRDVRHLADRHSNSEQELVLDPGFFTSLANRLERISGVGLALKRGVSDTEMNRFRYDVYLHVENPVGQQPERLLELKGDPRNGWRERIESERSDYVSLTGVVNKRTIDDVVTAEWLYQNESEPDRKTLRNRITEKAGSAWDPEELASWAEGLGYSIALFESPGKPGFMDSVLVSRRYKLDPGQLLPACRYGQVRNTAHANDPMRPIRRRTLATELRRMVRQQLPDYMQPAHYTFLERLPLTPSGKLDRRGLPAAEAAGLIEREIVAPRTQLEIEVLQIWQKVLNVEVCGVNDNFFEMGGHSLSSLKLIQRIEKQMGKTVSVSTLFRNPTVEGITSELQKSLSESQPSSNLIALHPQGTLPPWFMVHPLAGTPLAYLNLSRSLGDDQPFYGLQACGITDDLLPLESVNDMAVAYVAEIKKIFPKGPYFLGGWSLGGIIAFEMARILKKAGERVAALVIIDAVPCSVFNLKEEKQFLDGIDFVTQQMGYSCSNRKSRVERLQHLLQAAKADRTVPIWFDQADMERLVRVMNVSNRAYQRYDPDYFSGMLTFVKALKTPQWEKYDPVSIWSQYCDKVNSFAIDCDHNEIFKTNNSENIASIFRRCRKGV